MASKPSPSSVNLSLRFVSCVYTSFVASWIDNEIIKSIELCLKFESSGEVKIKIMTKAQACMKLSVDHIMLKETNTNRILVSRIIKGMRLQYQLSLRKREKASCRIEYDAPHPNFTYIVKCERKVSIPARKLTLKVFALSYNIIIIRDKNR